jgi:hypothetical protein
MYDPTEKRDGAFYPDEMEEMAGELKRREMPTGSEEDREDLAAEIVRRRQLEHEQSDREREKSERERERTSPDPHDE